MIKFEKERDFEDFLYKHFLEDSVCLIDGAGYDKCLRQLDLGAYGITDLVYINRYDECERPFDVPEYSVLVVELKNEQIKVKDIAQIARYKTCFEKMLPDDSELTFSLVVPEGVVNNEDSIWIINSLSNIDVYEFKLDPYSGIKFCSAANWRKTNYDYKSQLEKIKGML